MKRYIIIALASISLWGCKRDKDLYINPTNPATVTPATLLTNVEVNTFMNFEGGIVKVSSIFIQQNAGVGAGFSKYENYDVTEDEMDNYWNGIYSGTLLNARILSNDFGAQYPYYDGISKILFAMNLGLATDAWGDVPYSEAFQIESGNLTPKFDKQEDVIKGIQLLLDSAITQLAKPANANLLLPAGDDLIFNGDVELWTKTAWTLKARYANRLSLKDPIGSANRVIEYLQKGITSSSEDCMTIHGSDGASQNQWYAFQQQRRNEILAGGTLVDSMLNRPSDLRVYSYFDSTGLGGVVGVPHGEPTLDASEWGNYLATDDKSVALVSFVEAKFLEAEAKIRLSNTNDAADALNEGIMASAEQVTDGKYSGASIATYTGVNVSLSRIMFEKWIAMFGQMEAYNDYRRTGLPVLQVNTGAVRNYIPQRFPTAFTERVANANAPVYELNEKVWWALP